jgi:hypothetical protein
VAFACRGDPIAAGVRSSCCWCCKPHSPAGANGEAGAATGRAEAPATCSRRAVLSRRRLSTIDCSSRILALSAEASPEESASSESACVLSWALDSLISPNSALIKACSPFQLMRSPLIVLPLFNSRVIGAAPESKIESPKVRSTAAAVCAKL